MGCAPQIDFDRRALSWRKTGITSKAPPSNDLADAMRAGSLSVACLADVPDMPVLGRSAEGALAMVRAPATGELYRYHLDRLAWMDVLVAHHGVCRALCAADLEEAHRAAQPAIIGDVEGLDFSMASWSGWRKRTSAVCGTCSSSIIPRTTLAISRPAPSRITASPNSAPR